MARTVFDVERITGLDCALASRESTVCGVDLASRMPTSLVAGRCSYTVRRHLKAKKAGGATCRSGPCSGSQRPAPTRSRSCVRRASPVAQQRRRTSFEDRAKCRGEQIRVVARRSRTVVKGRRRKRSRNGTVHSAADPGSAASPIRPRRMPSEPPVHLLIGASVFRSSSLFLLRPSTRPRPSRVRARRLLPAPSSPAFSTSAQLQAAARGGAVRSGIRPGAARPAAAGRSGSRRRTCRGSPRRCGRCGPPPSCPGRSR